MPAPRTTDAAGFSYAAPFPYYVRTRKKGRRTYDSTLVKGTHYGTMPVAARHDVALVFEIEHANGVRQPVSAWHEALWTPMRDLDGSPLSPKRFEALVAGKIPARQVDGRTVHPFDPFSSPLLWKDGEPWGGVLVDGHIANNPEGPRDPSGGIEFDGEAAARARAARIGERLAVIAGAVHLRIPGPMWQISRAGDTQRRRRAGGPELPEAVMRPEWRIPMRATGTNFHYGYSVGDHRPGPLMPDGNFFAWNREDEARKAATRDDGSVVQEGAIRVLDRALAERLTAPGADLAASGVHLLDPLVFEISRQTFGLSDAGVMQWMAARRAGEALSDIWFGEPKLARDGLRALAALIGEFEEAARLRSTAAAGMLSLCAPALRRWSEFELPAQMAAAAGELTADDERAVVGLGR